MVPSPEDPLHPVDQRPTPPPPAQASPTQEEFILQSLQSLPRNNKGPNGETWYPKEFIHDYLKDKGTEYHKYYNPETLARADYLKAEAQDLRTPAQPAPMNDLDRSSAAVQNATARAKNRELDLMDKNGGRLPPVTGSPGSAEPDPVAVQKLARGYLDMEMPSLEAMYTTGSGKDAVVDAKGLNQAVATRSTQLTSDARNQIRRYNQAQQATPPPAAAPAPVTPPPPMTQPVSVPNPHPPQAVPTPPGGSSFLAWKNRKK